MECEFSTFFHLDFRPLVELSFAIYIYFFRLDIIGVFAKWPWCEI